MTVVCSIASFGSSVQVRHGATCQKFYGPRTTCYNRFVRWRRAGVWDQIMDALAAGHDAAVQMIDTSVVACISMEPVSRTTITKTWVAREEA